MNGIWFVLAVMLYFGAYFFLGAKIESALRRKHPEWKIFGGGETRRERLHETEIDKRLRWIFTLTFFPPLFGLLWWLDSAL